RRDMADRGPKITGKVGARHRSGLGLTLCALLYTGGCSEHPGASVGAFVDASTESGSGESGRDGAGDSAVEAAPLACTSPLTCSADRPAVARCCIDGLCSYTPPASCPSCGGNGSCADAGDLAIVVSSYDVTVHGARGAQVRSQGTRSEGTLCASMCASHAAVRKSWTERPVCRRGA